MATMYFKGGLGIKNPVDFNGDTIKEGDILTHSWFEDDYNAFLRTHCGYTSDEEIEKNVHKPCVVVKYNKEKEFFYGESYDEEKNKLYMHDFKFKYTKIITI